MSWYCRLLSILSLVLGDKDTFTLSEVYQVSEGIMSYYYPNNNTVQSSIRRNLEEYRDNGILTFVDDQGTYSWVR